MCTGIGSSALDTRGWVQLSIGSGLQILKPLVLWYARRGARRDGASCLPDWADLYPRVAFGHRGAQVLLHL